MEQLDHCRHQRLALNERSPSLRSDPDDPCNEDQRDCRSVAEAALSARLLTRRSGSALGLDDAWAVGKEVCVNRAAIDLVVDMGD
jgi:hypothetical protein